MFPGFSHPKLVFRKIRLRVEVENPSTALFINDKNLLKQILLNLVKNSIEAGATGIFTGFTLEHNTLTLLVKDNGRGIDEKVKAAIFKPYISTKTKGMGLGLHIVLRLVQALNGEIRLDSHAPGNTVFRVTLPGKEIEGEKVRR